VAAGSAGAEVAAGAAVGDCPPDMAQAILTSAITINTNKIRVRTI
jgi:hypothetical protein